MLAELKLKDPKEYDRKVEEIRLAEEAKQLDPTAGAKVIFG